MDRNLTVSATAAALSCMGAGTLWWARRNKFRDLPVRHYRAGEKIIAEGQRGHKMFILEKGRVEVRKGMVSVAHLDTPGSLLGEMSAILNEPHTADVVALEPTTVRVVEDSRKAVKTQPEVALAVSRTIAERLKEATTSFVEAEQSHLNHLVKIASGQTVQGVSLVGDVAQTIAELLSFQAGEIRDEAPDMHAGEVGAALVDGKWLVLSGPPRPASSFTSEDYERINGMVALLSPLIEAAQGHTRLVEKVHTDELTGVANRSGLMAFIQSRPPEEPIAAAFIDLDKFKPVNDTYGHQAGDHVLRQVGERLKVDLRPNDLAARVGGDEFAVALPGISRPKVAHSVVERIVESVRRPVVFENTSIKVDLSAGFSVGKIRDFETLLNKADTLMYQQKRGKKTGSGPDVR